MENISTVEAAKMLRKILRNKFPGVKFSVRKSGWTLRVDWIDGPSQEQVDFYAKPFAGQGFDGSIDMRYYMNAIILENGSVIHGSTNGTTGSMGYVESETVEVPEGAREVSFNVDFVFTSRRHSQRLVDSAIAAYERKFGKFDGKLYVYEDHVSVDSNDYYARVRFNEIINRRVIAA